MSVLLGYAMWFAIGYTVMAFATWLHPDWYDDSEIDSIDLTNGAARSMATIFAWPIALMLTLAVLVSRTVIRSKRENLRVRSEIEKELKAARKEIDDFIRNGTATK